MTRVVFAVTDSTVRERIVYGEDIVIFIKSRRLTPLGHVERMPKKMLSLRILDRETLETRKRGRPRRIG